MVKIEFSTGNAAFEDGYEAAEILACLDRLKGSILSGRRSGKVMDSNGNCVGGWTLDAKNAKAEG